MENIIRLQNSISKEIFRRIFMRRVQILQQEIYFENVRTMVHTGIFEVRRNSNNASREPRVDAWTNTPLACTLIASRVSARTLDTSSCGENTEGKIIICHIFVDHCKLAMNKDPSHPLYLCIHQSSII